MSPAIAYLYEVTAWVFNQRSAVDQLLSVIGSPKRAPLPPMSDHPPLMIFEGDIGLAHVEEELAHIETLAHAKLQRVTYSELVNEA